MSRHSISATTPASFSTLPVELRRAIWYETLTPRTLSIVPHYGSTSTLSSDPVSVLPFVKTHPNYACSLTFAVAEGLHPRLQDVPYWFEPSFRKAIDAILGMDWRKDDKYRQLHPSVPWAPVALHICCESRQVALEHYTLAFAGTNILSMDPDFTALFNASGLGQKRTWVDWKRDTIFVVQGDSSFVEMRSVYGEPFYLEVLAWYAKGETEKIQRLAVAGHWTANTGRLWEGKLEKALIGSLKLFTGLKELVVYHSDVSWDDFLSITEEDEEEWNRRTAALVRGDEGQVREEIVGVLNEEKGKDEKWTSDVPRIVVSRDWQWCWRDGEPRLVFGGPGSE
jgi:hypothetical protein